VVLTTLFTEIPITPPLLLLLFDRSPRDTEVIFDSPLANLVELDDVPIPELVDPSTSIGSV